MPTSSVDAFQVSRTEKDEGVAARPPGTVGAVLSAPGPRRAVPKAASSYRMSLLLGCAVSPIWNCATGPASPRSTVAGRLPTGAPSSQTCRVEDDPFTPRWSSRACHAPLLGTVKLV